MTRLSLILALIAGCAIDADPPSEVAARRSTPFSDALDHTNGRSCASCHVLTDHGVLAPDHVAEADPGDPLFDRIDADDPAAVTPQFEHLAHGLVRVTLNLPPGMDVIDAAGHVITRADRTLDVWRGVPTIENVAITAPYQLDGRISNLRDQAQAAITSHSQGPIEPTAILDAMARFERTQFSSPRATFVAALAALGVPLAEIPIPERAMHLTAAQRRGRDVFDRACARCHGGATTNTIVDRTVHDALFFELAPDGTVVYDIVDGQPVPRQVPRPHDEFANVGFALLSGYGQLGALPMANADVELPRYRFRFYRDGSRTSPVVDLPPIPRDADGNPVDPPNLATQVDARGAPIVGPSLGPEWFSSDPGRAIVTGDPADFEAFDVPQLRGIANTAPYMHDNSHATLGDVVDSYSRFVLPFLPIGMPPIYQDSPTSPFGESLTLDEKHDLVAFLMVL
jgi:cytochrome c peroxidase